MHPFIEMQAFFEERAAGWEHFVKKEWLPNVYEHYYTLLASEIPNTQKPIKILDIGCGGGIEFEWIFKRAPNAHITGIDQSEPMLNCLREKYADQLDQFTLIHDSYLTCLLEPNTFDFVITSMSVHYFRPPIRQGIYQRIHKTLKEDGIYIEGTYCSDSEAEEHKRLRHFEKNAAGINGADAGRFKINLPLQAKTISHLLKEAGFPVVEWLNGESWVVTAKKK